MNKAQHIAATRKALGADFAEVHDFLDQFWGEVPSLGHRIILHHALGVELVVARFGEEARPAAELHIRDDMEVIQPTPQAVYQLVQVMVHPHRLAQVNAILHELGLPLASPPL